MIVLLVLIIGTTTGFEFKCPVHAEWRLRAHAYCVSAADYVCLFHLLDKKYQDVCLRPDQSSIGSKLVFQPHFNIAKCKAARYQPIVYSTKGNSGCILQKSKCDEEGQVVYSNGSSSNDTLCRCDYTKGYTFVKQPNQSCFCIQSQEDCSCFRSACEKLSPDYRCINDGEIITNTKCLEIHLPQILQSSRCDAKTGCIRMTVATTDAENKGFSDAQQVLYIIMVKITVSIAIIIVITALKCYVFVPPKFLSQETITYDQGGKTTVLQCHVRSYLPLTSAVWCRHLPNNEFLEKKSSIAWNRKGVGTIIFETFEELEAATYTCKASNIIGAVESPPLQLNEKENDEECGKHYSARVIFIGKNGVGKTSLMRRLLWGTKEQSSSTQSTDDIDIKKCNINIEDGNWSSCNKTDHDLDRVIQQMFTERTVNENEAFGQNIETSPLVQEIRSVSDEDSKTSGDHDILQDEVNNGNLIIAGSQNDTNEIEINENIYNVRNNNTEEESSDVDDTSVDENKKENIHYINEESMANAEITESNPNQETVNTNQTEKFQDNQIKRNEVKNETSQENDMNIVQMVSSVKSCLNANESYDKLALCTLWDFAGPKEFFATHQVFLSKCAVFLLVTDSLESSYADQLWIDFKDTAQYVRFWFDAIHCYWSTSATEKNRLDPPIIVVCTNEDKIKYKEKHQSEFNMNLGKILNQQKQKEHLRNIYFVSNTEDDDDVFQEIRQEISNHAMNINDWGKKCPLKWLLFQQVLGEIKDSNVPISTTTNLKIIAKHDSIGIDNDEEFKKCLEYFHDIGSVIYFDEEILKEHVILDPKWLIDAFKCLVTDNIENIVQSSDDWQTLKETGALTPKLIDLLFKKVPNLKFVENKNHLLKVMKRFDIILQLSNSSVLYMPCMMKSCPFTVVKKTFMKKSKLQDNTSWLCLVFEFLPPAFFNHILAWFIKSYDVSTVLDKRTHTQRNALYRQICVFDLHSNDCEQVVVCEGPNVVALQVWNHSMHSETYGKMAKQLFEFITSIEMRYRLRVSYTKSFKCKDGNFTTNQNTSRELVSKREYWCSEHKQNHKCDEILEPWIGKKEIERLRQRLRQRKHGPEDLFRSLDSDSDEDI